MNIKIHISRNVIFGVIIIGVLLFAFFFRKVFFASAWGNNEDVPTGAIIEISTRNNKAYFSRTEDIVLQVTLTNPNDYPIKILKWLTPVDGVKEPLFTVLRDGMPVEYLGPVYKRAAPTEQDYMTVEAGESLTKEANLSALYNFSTSGDYEIIYDVASIQLYMEVDRKGQKIDELDRLTSKGINLYIEGRSSQTP